MGSKTSYGGSESTSSWFGRNSAEGGLSIMASGIRDRHAVRLQYSESRYTVVFMTSLRTAKPPAMSPYKVQYPVLISLLFPVLSTIQLNLFESDIKYVPRTRAWMFSSVTSGLASLKASDSAVLNAL